MAHAKSNADHLRDILVTFQKEKFDDETAGAQLYEALEFVEAMEEQLNDAVATAEEFQIYAKETELERDSLQEELDSRPVLTTVFLGLDTLHYRLENGNLRITQQLESWVNNIKHENGAGVQMPTR